MTQPTPLETPAVRWPAARYLGGLTVPAGPRVGRLPPPAWNDTGRDYPQTLLHEAFEQQAVATPTAAAVRAGEASLSYADLAARAEALASQLASVGVEPGSVVGVCLERSIEMVVSILGVLKAGGAYLPIDPDDPPDRIAFTLADAAAANVLTQARLRERLEAVPARVIAVDEAPAQLAAATADHPRRPVGLDDLAYVIYTSGSTGQPKGAMVSHRAISNRIHWMQEAYDLTPADRVLQKTPFSFDVSVWEFFWPLSFGAELVMAEPRGHRDPAYLSRTIRQAGITTVHFVPSMLSLFLDDPEAGACSSLRRVICSGEALPRALQDRFFGRLAAELHNLYGPTEAAVDVTSWACDPSSELPFVPIGRPIANTRIHLLDAALQPVPVGEVGELHIGGVQVAQGYLGRPELTAERFIADPFGQEPGARLYKTGDLARYLPDGNIEFLGRNDAQVKIRGFRVELGEIEASLGAMPSVDAAVVVARQDDQGEATLLAYVSQAHDAVPAEALCQQLRASLPEYMVPTSIISVERFPLTANGKIDRRALPEPAPLRARPGLTLVPPRTPLERLVADRWRHLLGLDRVGRQDRFFDLGGTSLQAARFVNQMQRQLGESIFVTSLFQAPSVADYAAFLQQEYPVAVARIVGTARPAPRPPRQPQPITATDLAAFTAAVPARTRVARGEAVANPPALFILGPPRSGTTLLRIMLAGHPELFSASELQLLGFDTLAERTRAYAGAASGWLDGTVRAIMQIEGIGADEARARMSAAEAEGLSTRELYARLQASVAPRLLVDKSPSYALDPLTLASAERIFERPRYIHLVRAPEPMIDSFERHHMQQVLPLRRQDFGPRQLGELVWTASHGHILDFLGRVPEDRWARLHFEALVDDPEPQLRALCERLGLSFDDALLRPYERLQDKMVDGVFPESAPMGDPGFLAHGRIDATVATRPRSTAGPALGAPTRELAERLGYGTDKPRSGRRRPDRARLVRQRPARGRT